MTKKDGLRELEEAEIDEYVAEIEAEKLDKLRTEVAKLDQIRRVPGPLPSALRSRHPIAWPPVFADF